MTVHSQPKLRGALVLALVLLAVGPLLFSGAWTPEKGKVYLKLSANRFTSTANYNMDGDSIDPFAGDPDQYSRFTDRNLSVYFETGLTNRLALFGSLSYKDIEQRTVTNFIDVGIENSDLSDLDLGLRYRLTEGPNVFSVAFMAKLPYLYDEDNFFANSWVAAVSHAPAELRTALLQLARIPGLDQGFVTMWTRNWRRL